MPSTPSAPGVAVGGTTGTGSRWGGRIRSQLGLATLLVVLFLTFLDNTIISVTLAAVQSSLHAGVSQLQWVIDAYALVFAAFMLTAGTLGDLFGRKKVMLGGVIVFCAGSLIGALAVNSDVLIAARVVMGIGAAASEPGTLSMIRHLYPDTKVRGSGAGRLGRRVGPGTGDGAGDRRRARRRVLVAGRVLVQPLLRPGGAHRGGRCSARDLRPRRRPPRHSRVRARGGGVVFGHLRHDRRGVVGLPEVVDRPAFRRRGRPGGCVRVGGAAGRESGPQPALLPPQDVRRFEPGGLLHLLRNLLDLLLRGAVLAGGRLHHRLRARPRLPAHGDRDDPRPR